MAITTYQLQPYAGVQYLFAGDALHHVLSVPASAAASVVVSADGVGDNVITTVAPGATANFGSMGGFYYSSASPVSATAVSSSQKLGNLVSFSNVTNSTAETVGAQIALPASLLYAGAVVRVRYQITCSGVTGTPTLQGALYLGAAGTTADTALITASTTAILANGIQTGEMLLSVRAAPSATSAIVGTGSYALAGAAGQAVVNATLASTNFATNAQLFLSGSIKWSAASASNIAAFTVFEAEIF